MSHKVVAVACILTILSLSLISTSFLVSPVGAPSGLYVVAYNPYAGVDWNTAFRLKTQLHAQTNWTRGYWAPSYVINDYWAAGFDALGISDPNQLTWPWSEWIEFINPAAYSDMVPIPNDEVTLSTAHFVAPFITSAVNGTPYGTDVQGAINAVIAVGGLPIISHPYSSGFSLTTADSWTGFQGIEIYNRWEDGGPLRPFNFQLWDQLLRDPARAQKHIWGFAVDDSNAQWGVNRAWIVVYASQNNTASMKDSIIAGSFVAVVNGTVSITSVTQGDNTLEVDASSSVVWKADGEQIVGTSSTLDLDTLEPGYTYVRAEVNDGAGAAFTQPIFITQTSPYTIFSNGFEDGFASWDNTVTGGGGWIGQSSDTARSGLYSARIGAIRWSGDVAYANKSLGRIFKRVNMRAYVNFTIVSTANFTVGPVSLSSSDSYRPARAAVVRGFALNKWGIRVTAANGVVTWYWEEGTSALATKTWYCIELEAAMSTHGFSTLWIDGEMKLNVTNIDFGASSITTVGAGEYMTIYPLSTFIRYYVDDVVVADSYIGPIQYGLTVGVSGHGATNATGTFMHAVDSDVAVLATADPGNWFDHWLLNGTNVGSDNPYTVHMTANYNLTAVFTSDVHYLTVSTVGGGSVALNKSDPYNYGEWVRLTALPDPGWKFSGWSGDAFGTDNPIDIFIDGNKTVTASFTQLNYTLTVVVSPPEGGSVELNNTGPYYHWGDAVELTATAAEGYSFDYWSGDLSGSANPAVIIIYDNESVTANFVPLEYNVAVTVDPVGTGIVSLNDTAPHYGDWVHLTATANPGWAFDQWTGDVIGTNVEVDVFIDGNKSVTAHFVRIGYVLTVSVSGHGSTNVTDVNVYDKFTNVTVLATPASGCYFDHWVLNELDVGSENPYTLNMTEDFNLTAVFSPYQRTLKVTVIGNGVTNATGTFSYDMFSNVTVLATPDLGYKLDHWLLNGSLSGSVNPYTLNMTDNFELTAVFTLAEYNLFVGIVGNGVTNLTGTQTYLAFTEVSVLATPDSGYYLLEWLLNGTSVGSANPYTVNMISNYNLTAVFVPVQHILTFESEKSWYWVDNTTVDSVVVGDVDGDGSAEIVTGGSYYDGARSIAQLCVWDGATMALENVRTWYWTSDTYITSVTIADVDGDSMMEIVTGGVFNDGIRDWAQLVVWDGATLELENVKTWYWTADTIIDSVAVADVDGDSSIEIVTGGSYYDGARSVAQLCVWDGATLALENVKTWYWTSDTQIYSVVAGDVDSDGSVEVVTGGYYNDGGRYNAQLCVWSGSTLALENVKAWYWTGSTVIESVAVGDVDGDGSMEIVTGGHHWETDGDHAQLVVWNGSDLAFENVRTWLWGTTAWIDSVTVGDVDADGSAEIVTGGYYYDGERPNAQLCVWEGSTLAVENVMTWYWTGDTRINSVVAGDVDGDDSVEMVTSGYFSDLTRSWAQLATWQITTSP